MPTPSGIISTSQSYVVVKHISQAMTCLLSLNVGGNTISNNTTNNGSLNCGVINTISNTTASTLNNLNILCCYSYLNIIGIDANINSLSSNSTLSISILNATKSSILKNFNSILILIIYVLHAKQL